MIWFPVLTIGEAPTAFGEGGVPKIGNAGLNGPSSDIRFHHPHYCCITMLFLIRQLVIPTSSIALPSVITCGLVVTGGTDAGFVGSSKYKEWIPLLLIVLSVMSIFEVSCTKIPS